jgi:hypothetical protein
METEPNDYQAVFRTPKSLWEEVKSLFRQFSAKRDADVSAHEITRRALRYVLAHPE